MHQYEQLLAVFVAAAGFLVSSASPIPFFSFSRLVPLF